jgi:hypothetical protein
MGPRARLWIWLGTPVAAFSVVLGGYVLAFRGEPRFWIVIVLFVAALVFLPVMVRGSRDLLRSLPAMTGAEYRALLRWNLVASGGLALAGSAVAVLGLFRAELDRFGPAGAALFVYFLVAFFGGLLLCLFGLKRIGRPRAVDGAPPKA